MGLEGRRIDDNTVVFGKPLDDKALNAFKKRSPTADSIIKSLPKSAFLPILKEEVYTFEEPEEPEEIINFSADRKAAKKKTATKKKPKQEVKMNLEEELEMLEQKVIDNKAEVLEEQEPTGVPEMKDQILELLSADSDAPSEETINAWKEKYGKNGIHVMAFGEGDIYIYHHLTRGEWKKIKDIMNRLKESGSVGDEVEEKLKEKVVLYCVLYPKIDDQWLEYCKAGVIDSLYQMILLNSGFLTPQQAMLLTTQL